MTIDPAQLAGGGAPAEPAQGQVAPGSQQGGDPNAILQALSQALQESMDEQGNVEIEHLIGAWTRIQEQAGLQMSFEALIQWVQANPQALEPIIQKLGIQGMVINGKVVSPEELTGQGSGAVGAPQGQVQTGGPAQAPGGLV